MWQSVNRGLRCTLAISGKLADPGTPSTGINMASALGQSRWGTKGSIQTDIFLMWSPMWYFPFPFSIKFLESYCPSRAQLNMHLRFVLDAYIFLKLCCLAALHCSPMLPVQLMVIWKCWDSLSSLVYKCFSIDIRGREFLMAISETI